MRLTHGYRNGNAPVGPLFEPLENRLLLAGTVTVAVSGSTLLLTGDVGDNQIVIDDGG